MFAQAAAAVGVGVYCIDCGICGCDRRTNMLVCVLYKHGVLIIPLLRIFFRNLNTNVILFIFKNTSFSTGTPYSLFFPPRTHLFARLCDFPSAPPPPRPSDVLWLHQCLRLIIGKTASAGESSWWLLSGSYSGMRPRGEVKPSSVGR